MTAQFVRVDRPEAQISWSPNSQHFGHRKNFTSCADRLGGSDSNRPILFTNLIVEPIGNRWVILALLTLLTGSFNVKVPSINAYISVSEAFVFASILLFGTPAGTATVVVECMVVVFWMKP